MSRAVPIRTSGTAIAALSPSVRPDPLLLDVGVDVTVASDAPVTMVTVAIDSGAGVVVTRVWDVVGLTDVVRTSEEAVGDSEITVTA